MILPGQSFAIVVWKPVSGAGRRVEVGGVQEIKRQETGVTVTVTHHAPTTSLMSLILPRTAE